jgi:hypothetical protein
MTPEEVRTVKRAFQLALVAAMEELERLLPEPEPSSAPKPGRPPKQLSDPQKAELLRLRNTNGKLSEREIARRIGASRYAVGKYLTEHEPVAENVAENPSSKRGAKAGSND